MCILRPVQYKPHDKPAAYWESLKMSGKQVYGDISDSKTTLNEDSDAVIAASQTIEVTADSVLIKKDKLGSNRHGDVYRGERVSMYSEWVNEQIKACTWNST